MLNKTSFPVFISAASLMVSLIACSLMDVSFEKRDGRSDAVETIDGEDADVTTDLDAPGEPDPVEIDPSDEPVDSEGDVDVAEPVDEDLPVDIPPTCGNGAQEEGEECDDGANGDNCDGCLDDCTIHANSCGDGFRCATEECDDGANGDDCDGCLDDCTAHANSCGDGVLCPPEECDNATVFCTGCNVRAGWMACSDSSGNPAYLFVDNWTGTHSWTEYRDRCRTTIAGLSPTGYAYYGLAVFADQAIWDCLAASGSLNTGSEYYVGLQQSATGAEPAGGWYWNAFNGTAWINLSAYDVATSYLPGDFDDLGGTGPADCGRIKYATTPAPDHWMASDYACASAYDYEGICMIQF